MEISASPWALCLGKDFTYLLTLKTYRSSDGNVFVAVVVQTELEHFERRINKHEFFQKEAEMSRATLQLKKKYEDRDLPESHLKLESKAKSLGSKVSGVIS